MANNDTLCVQTPHALYFIHSHSASIVPAQVVSFHIVKFKDGRGLLGSDELIDVCLFIDPLSTS